MKKLTDWQMIDLSKIEGFDWDEENLNKNFTQHNITNKESEEVFENTPIKISKDLKHATDEDRILALGRANSGKHLTVIFTIRNNRIRIISARPQHKNERIDYHEK